jgi:hypothetical protein
MRKKIIKKKFERNCTKEFRSSKSSQMGKSQPNKPIPSLGKELTHKLYEKRKLYYSTTATGR